jgi:ankyrin repeat protein
MSHFRSRETQDCGFHRAAEKGYAEDIQQEIIHHTPPDLEGFGGCTALSIAVTYGQQKVVLILLDAGADPAHADKSGFTPLHAAASRSDGLGLVFINMMLAKLGEMRDGDTGPRCGEARIKAAVNALTHTSETTYAGGLTPLHYAAFNGTCETMKRLISVGADPNAAPLYSSGLEGETPLYYALSDRTGKKVRLLLAYGARPKNYEVIEDGQYVSVAEIARHMNLQAH